MADKPNDLVIEKPPETLPVEKPPETPQVTKFRMLDGSVEELTPERMAAYIRYGHARLQEEKSKKVEEPEEDLSIEEKYEKLEKRFNDLNQNLETRDRVGTQKQQLNFAASQAAETKDDPEYHQSIAQEVAAFVDYNPGLDIVDTYKKVLAQREKIIKKRVDKIVGEQMKVKSRLNGSVISSGGNLPKIDKNKPLDRNSLKDGTSRKLFEQVLMGQELE